MELIKNIFFNTDKLIQDTIVKISYTGSLFQGNSDRIFLHYGYDEDWKFTKEQEMKKSELGFQAEIKLPKSCESLNVTFRDEVDNWDNNNGKNYIFTIEEQPLSLALIDQTEMAFPRKLRKFYFWSKRTKLFLIRIVKYTKNIITGNSKDKVNNN